MGAAATGEGRDVRAGAVRSTRPRALPRPSRLAGPALAVEELTFTPGDTLVIPGTGRLVGLTMAGGLALALLVNRRGPFSRVVQGCVFTSYIVSWVGVSLLWLWLLDTRHMH